MNATTQCAWKSRPRQTFNGHVVSGSQGDNMWRGVSQHRAEPSPVEKRAFVIPGSAQPRLNSTAVRGGRAVLGSNHTGRAATPTVRAQQMRCCPIDSSWPWLVIRYLIGSWVLSSACAGILSAVARWVMRGSYVRARWISVGSAVAGKRSRRVVTAGSATVQSPAWTSQTLTGVVGHGAVLRARTPTRRRDWRRIRP